MASRSFPASILLAGVHLLLSGVAIAAAPPATTPRAAAPFDMTGTWVSVVTEDWIHRMVTPAKNDVTSGVPANAEGRRVASEWDLARDNASGEACRAYGAPGLMRQPGRIRIRWSDDDSLELAFDAGTQTRRLEFVDVAAGAPSWQGISRAAWQKQRQAGGMVGGGAAPFNAPTQPGSGGTLEVVTDNLRPGYLVKNGVPYSEATRMTEYFDVVTFPDGTPWLIVTAIVEDPTYLTEPWLVTTHFKQERQAAAWQPRPCVTPPPLVAPLPYRAR